jgi:tetratricopeptide (TPR) repeat protein
VKAVVSILLVFSWITLRPATCQTSEERIEQSFHSGQRALQEGNFALAVEEFKKVLALDPALLEAEVNLGLAYQSLYDYDSAARHLAKALHERPNLSGPAVIVGMDYLKLGSPEKAIPFLQQAIKLNPANRDAREALASAYLARENFRSAAEQYKQIALLETDKSEAWFNLEHQYTDLASRLAYRGAHLYRESAWGHRFLADLLFQRGRWADAVKDYQKAIVSEPNQSGLHTSMGQAYLHAQDLPEAKAEFLLELKLDSRNEPALLGLANAQLAGNQPGLALESLGNIWRVSPEFLALQREFPAVELPPESIRASIASIQNEPAGPPKHFFLAALCAVVSERACADGEWRSFQTGFAAWRQTPNTEQDPCKAHRYSRCVTSLEALKNPSDLQRLLLGKMYFTLQQYDRAADSLEQVQGVSGENAEASYWLARTYQAQGTEAYARLQELFPNSWRACQLRAEGSALRGDLDGAFKELNAALQLRPDEIELHEALGELYLDHRHADDAAAQRELEKVLTLDPARTRSLYLLGRLYVEKKDNEKALPYLQLALRLKPDFMEANSLLGTVYVRLGQFSDAIPRLQKAAPSDHHGNVYYQLYIAYRKLGQSELAKKELAHSEDLRRNDLERDVSLIMGSPQPEQAPQ